MVFRWNMFFVIVFFSQQKQSSEVFRKSHWKIPVVESLFNRVASIQACNIIKEGQVFFCKILENVKNTYFEEHVQTTASISSSFLWVFVFPDHLPFALILGPRPLVPRPSVLKILHD